MNIHNHMVHLVFPQCFPGGGPCFLRQVLDLRPAVPAELHWGRATGGPAAVSLGAVGFEVCHRSHDAPGAFDILLLFFGMWLELQVFFFFHFFVGHESNFRFKVDLDLATLDISESDWNRDTGHRFGTSNSGWLESLPRGVAMSSFGYQHLLPHIKEVLCGLSKHSPKKTIEHISCTQHAHIFLCNYIYIYIYAHAPMASLVVFHIHAKVNKSEQTPFV